MYNKIKRLVNKMGRPKKYEIRLTTEEVNELKRILRRKSTSKTIKSRCNILLDLDEAHGKVLTREQCAKSNGVCVTTVTSTAAKFKKGGIEEALSYKRSVNSDNARRKVDGRAEARIIELATSGAPEGHSKWTLRLLEEKCKVVLDIPVSKDTIGRTLKKRFKTTQK